MIENNQKLFNALNIITDGILVFCSFLLGYWTRFYLFSDAASMQDIFGYLHFGVWVVLIQLFLYAFFGLYQSRRNSRLYREFELILIANLLGLFVLQTFLFLTKNVNFSRKAIFLYFGFVTAAISLKKLIIHKYLRYLRKTGRNIKTILLVGSGASARKVIDEINSSPYLGYKIIGYVSDQKSFTEISYLGSIKKLRPILLKQKPDEVIAGLSETEFTQTPDIIAACEYSGAKLSLIPFYAQYLPAHPQADFLNGIPLINLRKVPLDNLLNAFLKRLTDIIGSAVLLVLTSPLLIIAAIGIKCTSPGPIFFRQRRVGKNKKLFTMYKLRSMRVNNSSDTAWTTNNDSRKTKFGAFLRKFSIDEIPQFWNVLKGDMSLVGPRPELPVFVNEFKDSIPLYMVKHQVRPGITGWAQINGFRGDTSIEKRIEFDVHYIENWTYWLDIKILLLTPFRGIINHETLM